MAIDPALAALLSFGGGLASAAGPSRVPVGLGQATGQAAMGGLAGYMQAQGLMQNERQQRLKELETLLKVKEGQRRRQAVGQMVENVPENQRALAQAYPEIFAKQQAEAFFAQPKEQKPYTDLGQIIADQRRGLISEGDAQQLRRSLLTGEETESTAALRTRRAKIADYMNLGMDRPTATLMVDKNMDVIPTNDGRLVMRDPFTGETKDITPQVRGGPMLPQGTETAVGEDLGITVGPGPRTSEVLSKYVGSFVAGAGDPEIDKARQNLRLLERQARGAFTLSSRPSQWEQSLIKELFPSEDFFESPNRAEGMLRQLKSEAAKTYNDYEQALRDPGVTGSLRSEMKQKQIELKRLYDSIQLPEPGGTGEAEEAAQTQGQREEEAAPLPKVGEIVDGYRFKGGDPNDPNSWERP